MQIYLPRHPPARLLFLPVGRIFLQKKLRPRQTEFIDALLHIPYHESIVSALFLTGNTGQDIFLHKIAVLVLINQDLMEMAAVFQSSFSRRTFSLFILLHQDRQCKMFNVIEIQNVLIPLLRLKNLLEGKCQIHQCTDRPLTDCHLFHNLFFALEKVLFLQIPQLFLHRRADSFHHLTLACRNRFILLRREPAKSDRLKSHIENLENASRFVRFRISAFLQDPLRHLFFLFQQFPVHIRSIRFFAHTDRLRKLFHTTFQKQPRLPQQLPYPRDFLEPDCLPVFLRMLPGFRKRLCGHHLGYAVILLSFLQPLLRKRRTHGKVIEFQHHLLHRRIPAAGTEIFHTMQKSFFLSSISGLQRLFQCLLSYQLSLALLGNPKAGIQADRMELVAQHKQTEAVNGCDPGIMQ